MTGEVYGSTERDSLEEEESEDFCEETPLSLEMLPAKGISQEESGTISTRPRSVMNAFLLISIVLLQKCFSLSIKHSEKRIIRIFCFLFSENPQKREK